MTGLEALEYITKIAISQGCQEEAHQVAFKSEIVEKELKALEIVKNSFADLRFQYREDTNEYFICMNYYGRVITQEEYDLLKEVLNYE